MKYLFDNNTISDLYDKKSTNHSAIIKKFHALSNDDGVVISIVTLYELEYALCNAPENKQIIIENDINHLKLNFEIVPLSAAGAKVFGALKKQLKDNRQISKENIKKHNIDIMLASCAICERATLVSADGIYPYLKQLDDSLCHEDWTL